MRAGPPILPLLALLVAVPASALALTAKVVVTARGTAPSDLTGFSVAPAGDVDGDGVPDLLASSMVSDASGDVRILFLGPGRDAAWDRTISGTSEFGYSIAGGFDLDGDGSPDFVAGSPNYSLPCGHNSCFARGRVTVLPKEALQITDAIMSAAGDPFTYQGFSITVLPDFNGDGKPDLAAVSQNLLRVWFGGAGLDSAYDLQLATPIAMQVKRAVAPAGDFDGDGQQDLALAPGSGLGPAQVFRGGPSPDLAPDFTLELETSVVSVAGGGDLNGDGFDDLAVSRIDPEAVDLYWGGPEADAIPDLTLEPPLGDDAFGTELAMVGDVDGDGFKDLLVGAPNQSVSPRVYLYRGGPGFDAVADDVLVRPVSTGVGFSIAGLGDVTGDGHADFAVGSPFASGPAGEGAGQVEVITYDPAPLSVPPPGAPSSLRFSTRTNPAHGSVVLDLALPRAAPVTITLHDLAGRQIACLLTAVTLPAGVSAHPWAPQSLAPGVYLARAVVGGEVVTTRWSWLGR